MPAILSLPLQLRSPRRCCHLLRLPNEILAMIFSSLNCLRGKLHKNSLASTCIRLFQVRVRADAFLTALSQQNNKMVQLRPSDTIPLRRHMSHKSFPKEICSLCKGWEYAPRFDKRFWSEVWQSFGCDKIISTTDEKAWKEAVKQWPEKACSLLGDAFKCPVCPWCILTVFFGREKNTTFHSRLSKVTDSSMCFFKNTGRIFKNIEHCLLETAFAADQHCYYCNCGSNLQSLTRIIGGERVLPVKWDSGLNRLLEDKYLTYWSPPYSADFRLVNTSTLRIEISLLDYTCYFSYPFPIVLPLQHFLELD